MDSRVVVFFKWCHFCICSTVWKPPPPPPRQSLFFSWATLCILPLGSFSFSRSNSWQKSPSLGVAGLAPDSPHHIFRSCQPPCPLSWESKWRDLLRGNRHERRDWRSFPSPVCSAHPFLALSQAEVWCGRRPFAKRRAVASSGPTQLSPFILVLTGSLTNLWNWGWVAGFFLRNRQLLIHQDLGWLNSQSKQLLCLARHLSQDVFSYS